MILIKKSEKHSRNLELFCFNKQIISHFPNVCNYQGKQLCYNGEKYEISTDNAHLPMHELKSK